MLATHLVVVILCCSEINLAVEEYGSLISSQSDPPGYKDIEELRSNAEFNLYAIEDFQINCYLYKIKMKKISYGCKKCICKDEVLECVNDDHSCEAGGSCYGDKDSWIQDDKNCTCSNGTAICKSPILVDKSETYEDQGTHIGVGRIPLKLFYDNSLFDLQWKNPNKRAMKYSFHMSTKENSAIEFHRTKRDTSSLQIFDDHQQVCFREFTAEVKEAELKRKYIIGSWTKIGVHATPCPDEIYYLSFMAHINDKCPKWSPQTYCIVPIDHCNSDSECPNDQVCCIISYCGPGCTDSSPHIKWKTISSPVEMLDLRREPPDQPFFLDEGFNAAGTRFCLDSHMLTPLAIVIWVHSRY